MTYLDLNVTRLNNAYSAFGISFVKDGPIIKMNRTNIRVFQTNPEIRSDIESKIDIIWNRDEYFWYLDERSIEKLGKYELKFTSDKTQDELKRQFYEIIETIEEEELKTSLREFFDIEKIFFSIPAATSNHHTYENGLLEHTVQVCELCEKILDYVGETIPIDKDILISGAILHDIGKINCYSYNEGITTITDLYKEQDHIINGVKLVSTKIRSEKIDKIIHIIASHHQTKIMGSPVEPVNSEAWIVHMADNLSAKILGG